MKEIQGKSIWVRVSEGPSGGTQRLFSVKYLFGDANIA